MTIPVLISLNIVVFVMWMIPSYFSLMANHFLVSWDFLLEGRFWTLITSVFSHNLFLHIFINMFVLKSFGGIVEETIGTRRFLTFYFLAGIFSSFCHCWVSAYLLQQPELPALGASGAIAGLILVFSFLYPREKIYIFGIIPIPALWGALAFVGLDVWGLVEQTRGSGLPIGHGAHIGGALFGTFYYFFFLRPKMVRR